jgi:parallel beta-helix repeat protein
MRRKNMSTVSLLIVVALFFLAFPCKGQAQSVDCDAGGNLQSAINSAWDGATILVTGICNENITFGSGRRYLTLDGGRAATIRARDVTAPTVLVRGDYITIRGFTISGGYDGVAVFKSGFAIIDDNTIESAGRAGINLENSATARIVNSTIRDNPGDGIKISENSSARIGILYPFDSVARPNTIEHNGGNGITLLRSSSAVIVGNTISDNGDNGIRVAGVSQADISANIISGNKQNGILVTQNSGVNLGNDTGDTIFDLPNTTTVGNGLFGLRGTIGAYADGRLGTLDGLMGRVCFDLRSINTTKPWSW